MASQEEPRTEAAQEILRVNNVWDREDLKDQLVKVELQTRVMAFEELADKLAQADGHYMSVDHVIASIRKTSRRMREAGVV